MIASHDENILVDCEMFLDSRPRRLWIDPQSVVCNFCFSLVPKWHPQLAA